MINLLSIILLLLLVLIGGKRGLKSFITIYLNIFLIMFLILLYAWGFNPIICSIIICIIVSLLILFYLNKINIKTISSFISVMIVLFIFLFITIVINNSMYVHGYSEENIENIGYVSYNTGLNMRDLIVSVVIIGLIGNIIDTSIAISSALYEVHVKNPKLTIKELFISGMNIGKDILGTTTNTLFFAFLGSCMTLFIYFQDYKYTFGTIINSKIFCMEFLRIILSGVSAFLIIPLTAFISSKLLKKEDDLIEKN